MVRSGTIAFAFVLQLLHLCHGFASNGDAVKKSAFLAREAKVGASAFSLPSLGFPYDALEGVFVGNQTMHLHHDRHHAFYVNMLNKALVGRDDVPQDVEILVQRIGNLPDAAQTPVRNHGGGHANHAMFWKWLKPGGSHEPSGKLREMIVKEFGSFANFQAEFQKAAVSRFGSGWAWLVLQRGTHKMKVCSTANQDNPLMDVDIGDCRGMPLLGLDVWEHAYYLDFFNLRLGYIKAFWKVVNFDAVQERFDKALTSPYMQDRSSAHMSSSSFLMIIGVLLMWCS